jgi:hypothetical protein
MVITVDGTSRTIAKMPRRVMQQRGNLVSMRARRCRQVEEIVSLVGIEPTEFLAEMDFVDYEMGRTTFAANYESAQRAR